MSRATEASVTEQAEMFGRSHRLVGVSSQPAAGEPGRHPAVILINAGLIHRIGPRRLHVDLARRLALAGRLVLRFDLSGIGDSDARHDELSPVDGVVSDTEEAMQHLRERFGVERFVLMGICSGAKVSFKVARGDPRVVGVILVDPDDFGFAQQTSLVASDPNVVQHHVRHYWRSVGAKKLTWRRVWGWVTGKANYRHAWRVLKAQLHGLFRGRRELRANRDDVLGAFRELGARGSRVLLLFTDLGPSLEFFKLALQQGLQAETDSCVEVANVESDHDFASVASQRQLSDAVCGWLDRETI